MAKRTSRYGTLEVDPDDTPREDLPDETSDTPVDPRPPGSESFRVLVPGTVIDGVEYPKREGAPEMSMVAHLPPDQAQELVNCGVRLEKINEDGTGEELVPVPKPEEEEPQSV